MHIDVLVSGGLDIAMKHSKSQALGVRQGERRRGRT